LQKPRTERKEEKPVSYCCGLCTLIWF
jgi:hypothetical protein